MAIGQLSRRRRLRDLVDNSSTQQQRFYHLLSARVSRSNLSPINEDKSHELYRLLFAALLKRCQSAAPGHAFRFKNKLCSTDASVIDVRLSVCSFALFRKAKRRVNLQVAMNHKENLPKFLAATEVPTHKVNEGRRVDFPNGKMVAIHRGYINYEWYKTLSDKGIHFVTRLKLNATTRFVERREVDRRKVLSSDLTIEFAGVTTSKRCPIPLRHTRSRSTSTSSHLKCRTNKFSPAANTFAEIYKPCWQIELRFKWIRQNLTIKPFMDASKNAVLTQSWIALCVHLLIASLKFSSKAKKLMQQILYSLRMNLSEKWCRNDLLLGTQTGKAPINPNQLFFVDKLTGH